MRAALLALVWLHRVVEGNTVSPPTSVAPCQVDPGHLNFGFFHVRGFVSGFQVRKEGDPSFCKIFLVSLALLLNCFLRVQRLKDPSHSQAAAGAAPGALRIPH